MSPVASNLQIDSARLWETIHETAKFGATAKGGVRRLTLGPEDKQVRDWFRKACEAAGLEVHVDALGSMFGLRKGRDMSKPPVGLGTQKFSNFVELHIEQGPILEAEGKTIGVVDSGQGVLWYDGKITGFESHAGSTPMPLRRDALATLSEIVLAMESIAKKHGPNAVGTVGEAVIAKPSRNVIPGEIAFTVDCRSADAGIMDALDKGLRAAIAEIAARRKVEVTLDLVWRKPPTHFDAKLVDAVENAAEVLGYSHRRITSGAGHDACNLNTIMPAAMVFVPCKDGVSHNELEDATQADCTAGANVLMHTVLALAGVAS